MQANDKGRSSWQPVWLLVIASLLVLGFMVWNMMVVQNGMLQRAKENYINQQSENISASIVRIDQEAEKMARQIADNNKLMEAFKKKDNVQLEQILQPLYRQWKQRKGAAELSLISVDGGVVWSSQSGVEPGDDMSYQRTTGKSLHQRKAISAVEASEKETMLVTTCPLFDGDEYLGLCRVGLSMPYLGGKLQQLKTGRFALFHLNGIDSKLLWQDKNKKVPSALNTNDIKQLHDGEIISRMLDYRTRLLIIPLQDIDGITVAYIQNHLPLQEYVQAEALNYLMLLLALVFIVLANYAFGRSRFDAEDDLTNNIARMSKINSVAFNVSADRTSKRTPEE